MRKAALLETISARTPVSAGLLFVLSGVALWATIGVAVRGVEAAAPAVLFWRGLGGGLAMLAVLLVRHGLRAPDQFRNIGPAGLSVVAWSVAGTLLFVIALRLSTVADVAAIYAILPFAAAAAARILWGVDSDRGTLVAAAFALLGTVLTLQGSVGSGTWGGNLVAFVMTLAYAMQVLLLGRHPELPVMPTVAMGSLTCAALSLPMADPLAATPRDILILLGSGIFQGVLADYLFMRGSQRLPATRTALLTTLDAPIAAVSAWLILAEQPADLTMIGGGVIVATVTVHTLLKETGDRAGEASLRQRATDLP